MVQRSAALPAPLTGLREQLATWWKQLAPRERRLVTIGATVLIVIAVWMLTIAPAWRTVRTAPGQIDSLDAQLQQMRRLAGETRDLRAAPPVSPSQAQSALRAASERLGSRAGLTLQGDRATLNLTGVQGPQLAAWLGEARTAGRARVSEATLARGPDGGYSGSIVLSLGSGQ